VTRLSKYDEEVKRQKELTKKLTVDEINSWIKSMPAEKRKQVAASVGTKSFTPEELLREVERDTEYGKMLVQMFNRLRVELSKKGEQ
jgi:predicted PP-loop superfamily ATPase